MAPKVDSSTALKMTDLETGLEQLQTQSSERFEKMEQELAGIRSESEKRHAEVMALLLKVSQPAAPPPTSHANDAPPPPPTQPMTQTTLQPIIMSLPAPTSAAVPSASMTGGWSRPPGFSTNLRFNDSGFFQPPSFHIGSSSANRENKYYADDGRSSGDKNNSWNNNYEPFMTNNGPPQANHGNGGGWIQGTDYRLRKLKMPLFDGDDAYGWVYKAERFFDMQGLATTGERLRAAVLCLEGPVLAWYRWSETRAPFRSWEELKHCLLDRFQTSQEGSVHEQFLAITQEGSARDYVGLFEQLAAQLDGLPEQVLEGTFIKGLKPELRATVRTMQPVGLSQAIRLAMLIDENQSPRTGRQGKGVPRGTLTLTSNTEPNASPGPPAPTPYKRMTEAEFADKRAKGLCFRCNGRFTPGHNCSGKSLQILLVHDDEEDEEELQGDGAFHAKSS